MSLGAWVKTQWRRVFLFDYWGTWFRSRTILRPRWLALGMYVSLLVAGLFFTFDPPVAVDQGRLPNDSWSIIMWHIFLLSGGVVATLGCLIRRPLIEAAGLPILMSATLAYSIIAADLGSGSSWGNAALLFGVTCGLGGRLWELVRLSDVLEDMEDRGL